MEAHQDPSVQNSSVLRERLQQCAELSRFCLMLEQAHRASLQETRRREHA